MTAALFSHLFVKFFGQCFRVTFHGFSPTTLGPSDFREIDNLLKSAF